MQSGPDESTQTRKEAWGIESPTMSEFDSAAPLLADVLGLPVYGQI